MTKTVFLILLSFAGIYFGKSVFSVSTESISFTNSIFSVLLFIVLFILLRNALSQNKQNRIFHRPDNASFCSVVFVLCMMVGQQKRVRSYTLLGLVWLTYLLGPTYLVRYVVFLWFALPILTTDFLAVISKKEK